jgi:hypothetical protein
MQPITVQSIFALLAVLAADPLQAAPLEAGVAKADITDYQAGPVNDPSYVKVLVFTDGATKVVIITVDAVALGEIGRIGNRYVANVRAGLQAELGIAPSSVIINASHCHSIVRADIDKLTVETVKQAWRNRVPVRVGAGRGEENRISENRRLKMKDGSEVDIRRAYSMPRDEDVAGIGPIDPEIGLLRVDRMDGQPLAVIYNFACHPIHAVPSGANTADYPGFASKVIEENFGEGVMALFIQGSGGDINPTMYKEMHTPHDAEKFGNLLGLSALRALRAIRTLEGAPLRAIREVASMPRGADLERRMAAIAAERARLLESLQGTNLNFKSFLALFLQHKLSADFPAYYSHRYLHERAIGRDDLSKLDAGNRADLEQYLRNIQSMEQLTRLGTNLALLEKHHAENVAAGNRPFDVDVMGVRIGDFTLVTFPGELTVEVGLNIKKRAPAPFTFVAGYTNGYIYYTPTAAQRNNTGYAQEDCDSMVGPEWQQLFESRAAAVLERLRQ